MPSGEAAIDGVIDYLTGDNLAGWIETRHDGKLHVVIMIDDREIEANLSAIDGSSDRRAFHAILPRPCSAAEIVAGRVRVEARQGDTVVVLACWEPLAVAAMVEAMTPGMVSRLLQALPDARRATIAELLGPGRLSPDEQPPTAEAHLRRKRALFGNAAFEAVAGSELVILEAVEHLVALGWACEIVAWHIGEPMRSMAIAAGATLLTRTSEVRPFTYDLVWLQNRLEPVFDYARSLDEAPRTLFVFAHLDRSWSLAQPGIVAEHLLGELFVVTSERAVDLVVKQGLPPAAVRMFRNAAPQAFAMPAPEARARPERILLVSNHPPREALEAARILRDRGIDVAEWGTEGGLNGRRLLPENLAQADAVITIGKTVSYALRARRPVYVYDHFGGPGWLVDDNFAEAAAHNFSGRCCERRIGAEQIADEIIEGFAAAASQGARREDAALTPFALETFMTEVLTRAAAARSPAEHRARLALHPAALAAERQLAAAAGQYFAAAVQSQRPPPA